MTRVEELSNTLKLFAKHKTGGVFFVINPNRQKSVQEITQALTEHGRVKSLEFNDQESLTTGHKVLRELQFEVEEGKVRIISMPEELYSQALRGDLGEEVQKDISDAFARRRGVIDED